MNILVMPTIITTWQGGLSPVNLPGIRSCVGHFTQADTLVPNAGDSAAYDRYAYVKNNPIKYNDPSGHCYNYSDAAHAAACDTYWRNYGLAWQIAVKKTNFWIVNYTYSRMIRNSVSRTTGIINVFNAVSNSSKAKLASESRTAYKAEAYLLWGNQVGYGKEWDYKEDIKGKDKIIELDNNENYQKVKKNYFYYDTWSNIHYGFVGAAAGFSLNELQDGAGAAQFGNELFTKAHLQPYDRSVTGMKGYDPAPDREGIRIGYDLFQKYGLALNPEDLISAIETSKNYFGKEKGE